MSRTHYSFFFLSFVASLLGFSLLGKVKIEASFDPPTITSANQSTYKVVVHGTQKNPIGSVPSVDGLNFSTPPSLFSPIWKPSMVQITTAGNSSRSGLGAFAA